VLYTYGASEDSVALDTLSVLGWKLDTLSDVSSFNYIFLKFTLLYIVQGFVYQK
jgi:hypothetical protein